MSEKKVRHRWQRANADGVELPPVCRHCGTMDRASKCVPKSRGPRKRVVTAEAEPEPVA